MNLRKAATWRYIAQWFAILAAMTWIPVICVVMGIMALIHGEYWFALGLIIPLTAWGAWAQVALSGEADDK